MKKSPSAQPGQNRSGSIAATGVVVGKSSGKSGKAQRKGRPTGKTPAALLEEHVPKNETRSVRFAYFNPEAREVFVVGTFNGWQSHTTPMVKTGGDKWSTELRLEPGRYEYRFIVDGQWQDDPMAARFVANSFGGLNCVVEVKPPRTPAAHQA
jgi:1,4-alpha-glucan branching enzyme